MSDSFSSSDIEVGQKLLVAATAGGKPRDAALVKAVAGVGMVLIAIAKRLSVIRAKV